jgi:hypothetical protein
MSKVFELRVKVEGVFPKNKFIGLKHLRALASITELKIEKVLMAFESLKITGKEPAMLRNGKYEDLEIICKWANAYANGHKLMLIFFVAEATEGGQAGE